MADLANYVDLIHLVEPRRRYFRDHQNPMEIYSAEEFRCRFRFRKETIRDIIMPQIIADLTNPTRRNHALTPIQQLCCALRFYASGSYQRVVGDSLGLHNSTVSKVIRRVSIVIIRRLKNEFLRFPDDADELLQISNQFFEKCGFPGVVGAIDCTHIRIVKPKENPAGYINRKNYYSLNCQMICDCNLRFFNVVVRWPGATHDSRIFENSSVCYRFEAGELEGILLGDPGYACLPYLMTPVSNPNSRRQHDYNKHQRRGRNVIERAFGVLKHRFSALSCDSRLRCKLDTTMAVIVACTVLHNISIVANDPFDAEGQNRNEHGHFDQLRDHHPNARGNAIRQAIIDQYF